MKRWLSERQSVKLSHLENQRENLQQEMESLCEEESTLKASLKEVEAVSFLEGYKDLLCRLESRSHFSTTEPAPPRLLDFPVEEQNVDSLIQINDNLLKEIQTSLSEGKDEIELAEENGEKDEDLLEKVENLEQDTEMLEQKKRSFIDKFRYMEMKTQYIVCVMVALPVAIVTITISILCIYRVQKKRKNKECGTMEDGSQDAGGGTNGDGEKGISHIKPTEDKDEDRHD
uniref:uncharacterized protein isoform X4 n=1 Tax=Myxine glutinosa TaxID=7769 RepID=UPI00358E6257